MLSIEDITDFDYYLKDNLKRNRKIDYHYMNKKAITFDHLTDQEPNPDRLAEYFRSFNQPTKGRHCPNSSFYTD